MTSDDRNFMSFLISKLGTIFMIPEETIVEEGAKENDMYFIIKGECAVNLFD